MAPTISKTINEAAVQITRGNHSWSDALGTAAGPITFAFRSTGTGTDNEDTFSRFSEDQIAAAEEALNLWSDVANITFSRVGGTGFSNNATILFGNYNSDTDGAGAYASFPHPWGTASDDNDGDVWVNQNYEENADVSLGSWGFVTLLHEIGHALGLEHPGNYNAGPNQTITYDQHAEYIEDSNQYTVMSYFGAVETGANHDEGSGLTFAAAPLLHDITAIQRLYGANMSTRTGDTAYGFNSNAGRESFAISDANEQVVFAVWDAGGVDTFDFSGYSDNQTIDLRAGGFSDVGALTKNVAIAQGVTIENARVGSGDDTITGNNVANRLQGNAGNDVLSGGNGGDMLHGDNGEDELTGGDGADWLYGGNNNDVLSGGNQNDLLYGEAGNDDLSGGNGNDMLDGAAGDDTLAGDAGNDQLLGGNGHDELTGGVGDDYLSGGWGEDELSGGIGNDKLFGGEDKDNLSGGDGNDRLEGGSRDDVLSGGNDNDTLFGGDGNDQVFGGNNSDTLDGGTGNDRLNGGDGADTMSGGTGNDVLVGSAANDTLRGDDGDDRHDGGIGADNMVGGRGNDTYYVDHIYDRVTDSFTTYTEVSGALLGMPTQSNAGTDTVCADLASFTLGSFLENLQALGANPFAGTGNALNNVIQGHNAADTLKGLAGNDVLIGRGGKDVLFGGKAPAQDIAPGFNVRIDSSADVFKYISATDSGVTASTRDVIVDFERGLDHIDLSVIDARSNNSPFSVGNNAFNFIATDDFSGVAGQLRYEHTGFGRTSVTVIEGDTNGDGLANFQIGLTGRHVLAAADFIL